MCLYISNDHHHYTNANLPIAWIAEEDIRCYKLLTVDRDSPYMRFHFREGDTYRTLETNEYNSFGHDVSNANSEANVGFHTLICIQTAKVWRKIMWSCRETLIFEAIIPKGSRYFIGDNRDLCSDQLKVLGRVWE